MACTGSVADGMRAGGETLGAPNRPRHRLLLGDDHGVMRAERARKRAGYGLLAR